MPPSESTNIRSNDSAIYIGTLKASPIGPLWVAVSATGLVAIEWDKPQSEFCQQIRSRFNINAVLDMHRTGDVIDQLLEYLHVSRRQFDLPLDLSDLSNFQQRVLHLTAQIPYGQTSTYKELAVRMGNPRAARAVGRVEATNPIPLVIPCHRVVGTDGSLHGYGGPGGIKLKTWLLQLEGALA